VADDMTTWGPFDSEPRGEHWPPRQLDPRRDWTGWIRARLLGALDGVELGAYDRRIVEWLIGWEPSTVAVIAGWVMRAKTARRGGRCQCSTGTGVGHSGSVRTYRLVLREPGLVTSLRVRLCEAHLDQLEAPLTGPAGRPIPRDRRTWKVSR